MNWTARCPPHPLLKQKLENRYDAENNRGLLLVRTDSTVLHCKRAKELHHAAGSSLPPPRRSECWVKIKTNACSWCTQPEVLPPRTENWVRLEQLSDDPGS